jgi:hypothetical protein
VIYVETNAAQMAAALRRYAEAIPRVVGGVLRSWVVMAADVVRGRAPIDTGGLAGSVHGEAIAGGADATIVAGKEYAAPVEFGSVEHEVVPRRKQWLRFPHRDGGWAFSQGVTIPAQEPQPFFYQTIDDQLGELGSLTDESLDELARQVGLDDGGP